MLKVGHSGALGRKSGSPVPEAVAGMIILFREVAEADLEEAISYYEGIDLDLTLRFQDAVQASLARQA